MDLADVDELFEDKNRVKNLLVRQELIDRIKIWVDKRTEFAGDCKKRTK